MYNSNGKKHEKTHTVEQIGGLVGVVSTRYPKCEPFFDTSAPLHLQTVQRLLRVLCFFFRKAAIVDGAMINMKKNEKKKKTTACFSHYTRQLRVIRVIPIMSYNNPHGTKMFFAHCNKQRTAVSFSWLVGRYQTFVPG